ncbi:exo-alpha-sialidase [Arsenicibacter rosenii]|uniref:exo-alpha-sialidase n=2 Tax=Arsenicibacter rosenii TaxID=1750698 RepID=A0A1S2VDI0_9BACT|nr:exo-alpha-sialidase [Arsenicibacter rosenii]
MEPVNRKHTQRPLRFWQAFRIAAACLVSIAACAQEGNALFRAGDSGYACFRIPAIVTTKKGTLLAFAEARRNSCGDAGDIDIVSKRSSDGGKTWSEMRVVWDDADNTCGNPAPVVDKKTGNIILVTTWNLGSDHEKQIIEGTSKDTRRVFVLSSADDGVSWSAAREITADVKQPGWTWYATGPCNGIQLEHKRYKGRLVIPCDHIEAGTKKYFSHSIHSDDGGKTWQLGGTTPTDKVNECTIAELPEGVLMLNMRNYTSTRVRQVSTSTDGGQSWAALRSDTTLIEPVCQGSLLSYNYKRKKPFLAFSNPANQKARVNMTVRLSYDQGKTWKLKQVVYEGPSAYSNLVVTPDGTLACFYEAGQKKPYEGIFFKELPLDGFKE